MRAFRKALRVAQAYVRRFTAQFIGVDEFRDRNGIAGAGVFLRVDERLFVATVAHNIDDGKRTPSAALLFISEHEPIDSVFTIMGGVTQGGKGDVDEPWDVAIVEVPLRVLERTKREALAFNRIDPTWQPEPDSTLLMFGLTEDGVVQVDDGAGVNIMPEHAYATMPLAGAPHDASVREGIDLFLSYPKDQTAYGDGELVAPLSPKGLSGGGVWTMPDDNPDNMRLVALVVAAHPHRDWVKAIRIEHALVRLRRYLEGPPK